MDAREFYSKSILESMKDIMITHLWLKYENHRALMITEADGVTRYHPIRIKEVLEKMTDYYHNEKKAKITWFYIRDLKDELEKRSAKNVLQH